jgi:acyl transferase domain-containing protein/acyl-CoA synthetase (AMP-forming)/AMP-acid ligase II/SAM-dependent methyltransferase/acyl carrier protein
MSRPSIDPLCPSNLVEMLRGRVSLHAAQGYRFVSDEPGPATSLSFLQLDARARAVAAALAGRGLRGERALLCYPPGLEFLVGLFGCLYAGVVAVPAYPPRFRKADPRLEGIAANCTPALLITTSAVAQDFDRLAAKTPLLRQIPVVATCAVPLTLAETWAPLSPSAADLAVLQYTSGSTGDPKGVMLTHGCILHNLVQMREILGLSQGTVAVCWLPAYHDMGLIGNLFQAVLMGGQMTLMSPNLLVQDPFFWLETISRQRAVISGGPCFAFQHALTRTTPEQRRTLDLRCWKVAYIGAEPISAAVLERFATTFAECGFRRETFFPCYGLAEATLMVTGGDRAAPPVVRSFRASSLETNCPVADEQGVVVVGCGQALPDLDVRIIDPQTRLPLPEGKIGEIWVAGPSVAAGYWDRPADTEETFAARCADRDAPRYLRTGDLGFLQAGELFVSGRQKDLIIIRGRNFYPHDIEAAVTDAVAELRDKRAAAFGVESEEGARLVLVQEIGRHFDSAQAGEVFRRARQALADVFEIELHTLALVKLGRLPRATSGKTRRGECRRLYLQNALEVETLLQVEAEPSEAPAAATVRRSAAEIRDWLVRRLARQLRTEPGRIATDVSFADFGLDSLGLVTIAGELEKWLQRPVSPTLLYEAPTIGLLAAALARGPQDAQAVTPAPTGGAVPIAVIGIGCRFPGAEGPEPFWQLLSEGRCAIGALPPGRWPSYPPELPGRRGGYLADVRHFDAAFFGITPKEAVYIDPQHRLLLEVAWEALENAGLPAERLTGAPVGVYVGISGNEYARLLLARRGQGDPYMGTGNALAMAAHRLSYHFDWHGPSVAIDTACSASLVAVHLACQALRAGECELALAGGVNLLLTPEVTEALARAQMLSPAGLCKTFDATADGYVRGEGAGLVVLKPLPAAVRDRDPILALVEATAINQDGRSNGITAPNGARQVELIRRVQQLAGRAPGDITYIETHGTGTPLGDPIEFEALQEALGRAKERCALGAVKANIGHLEAAAGIAGFIKTVLQLQHGQISPHPHLGEVNPLIKLAPTRFHIPTTLQQWSGGTDVRRAAVSAFGFGGTNAHVQLAAFAAVPAEVAADRPLYLLPLSARTEPALRQQAGRCAEWLRTHPPARLADVCFSAATGRTHFEHRLAVVAANREEAADTLRSWTDGHSRATLVTGHGSSDLTTRVAFLFTGQGAQAADMGRELYSSCPVYREGLDSCDRVVRELTGWSVLDMLGDAARLETTAVAQPALFAVEYALAKTWTHWGIEPAALLGHSLGELVAACVAGVFALEDGLRLAVERGRAMQACAAGEMLACFASGAQVNELLAPWQGRAEITAVNGPESVVIGGSAEVLCEVAEALAAHGLTSRRLRVDRAFHTHLIEPALEPLLAAARAIRHGPARLPLVSNRSGDFFQTGPEPDYWPAHARNTVQFAAGIQALGRHGITHFLEIGPDAVLSRLGPACLEGKGQAWLTSLRPGQPAWESMLVSLGRLYVDGGKVRWNQVDAAPRRRLMFPTYPFQRECYWVDQLPGAAATPQAAVEARWLPQTHWAQRIVRADAAWEVTADGLAAAAATAFAAVRPRHAVQRLRQVRPLFDRLAGRLIRQAFADLGWQPAVGDRALSTTLAERLGILPRYQRLLERLLTIGAEDGWLHNQEASWRVLALPAVEEEAPLWEELRTHYAEFNADFQLARHCARHLADVMRGRIDPLEVLFGTKAAGLTERLYDESPISRFYNDLLARTVEALVRNVPASQTLRVLELGAGSGATTAQVLPLLPAERTQYVFSDVSPLFLSRGQQRFGSYPFVQFRALDLEKDPARQGFADQQFDLVLAANVLHATADLRQSVRHAGRLLATGGLLMLLEGTGPRRLLDLIFGLTEGWWRATDQALRPDYPLIAPDAWRRLLAEEGFAEVVTQPRPDDELPDPDQVHVMARAGRARPRCDQHLPARRTATPFLLVDDGAAYVNALTTLLGADGHEVIAIGPLRPVGTNGCGRHSEDWAALLSQAVSRFGARQVCLVVSEDIAEAVPQQQGVEAWCVSTGAVQVGSSAAPPAWMDSVRNRTHPGGLWRIDLDPAQSAEEQAACLFEALRSPDEHVAVAYRAEQRYVLQSMAIAAAPPPSRSVGPPPSRGLNRGALLDAAPPQRRAMLEEFLRGEFQQVAGLRLRPEDLERPVQALGVDSLMALQLRNRVEAALGVPLSIVQFLQGLSLHQLVENILRELAVPTASATPVPAGTVPTELNPERLEEMMEGELDSLLHSLLQPKGPQPDIAPAGGTGL